MSILTPPTPRAPLAPSWGVDGAEPVRVIMQGVRATMQPAPWESLVRGLPDRAAAEAWLLRHAGDDPRLVHFLVHDASCAIEKAKDHPERWEHYDRGPDGVVRSARDMRRLDGGVDRDDERAASRF